MGSLALVTHEPTSSPPPAGHRSLTDRPLASPSAEGTSGSCGAGGGSRPSHPERGGAGLGLPCRLPSDPRLCHTALTSPLGTQLSADSKARR